LTDTVTDLELCCTVRVGSARSNVPTPAEAAPEIAILALPGLPRVALALGLLRTMSNALAPEKATAALIGMVIALSAESFAAH
jgi:hypothetical protein